MYKYKPFLAHANLLEMWDYRLVLASSYRIDPLNTLVSLTLCVQLISIFTYIQGDHHAFGLVVKFVIPIYHQDVSFHATFNIMYIRIAD